MFGRKRRAVAANAFPQYGGGAEPQRPRRRRGMFGNSSNRPNLSETVALISAGLTDLGGSTNGAVHHVRDGMFQRQRLREQEELARAEQERSARLQDLQLQTARDAGLSGRELLSFMVSPEDYGKSIATNYEAANVGDGVDRVYGDGSVYSNLKDPTYKAVEGENDTHVLNELTGDLSATGIGNKPRSGGVTVNNTMGGGPEPQGIFEEQRDKAFAQTYIDWTSGGGADSVNQISKIKDVIARIDAGENISGLDIGFTPNVIQAIANPGAVDARETIEEVVQRNLRLVLGAQFTEKEGERLISRAFNPKLGEEYNRPRLLRLFNQMETAAQQTQAMVNHIEQYGTLAGFQGQTPRMEDFYAVLDQESGGANTPRRRRWNPTTNDFEDVE